MYHSSNLLALVALASVSLANPLPNPQYIFGTTNCDVDGLDVGDKKDPATKVDNPAPQQLDYCTPRGGAVCNIGVAKEYSVGVTIEVGGSLGLDVSGIGGDIGVSVATETVQGTTTTTGEECQGPWSCALLIIPNLMRVTGQHTYVPETEICTSKTEPFTIDYPVVNPDKTPNVGADVCACPNLEHATDEGAPPPCPNPCG